MGLIKMQIKGTRYGLLLLLLGALAVSALPACGGGEKKTSTTADNNVDNSDQSGDDDDDDDDDELIPEEKFDEIKNTFERKATTVAHCFPDAVSAGEATNNDRIKVTVSVEVQKDGHAKDLKILGSSKRSKTLESCILTAVSRWEFTTLPKPVVYSYAFVLQQL